MSDVSDWDGLDLEDHFSDGARFTDHALRINIYRIEADL